MVDRIGPVDAASGAPQFSGRWERQVRSPYLGGATAVRPLGARSGVRPGTSTTTVSATSTTWSCGSFAGVIDGEPAAEAGAYTFAFDAAASGTLTAANASNPRVDIVYVQVDDPSESDGTSVPAVRRGYLAGVAAATPVAPAAPARSFVVAQINVPVAGGGNPTVTWVAPYAVAAGGVLLLGAADSPQALAGSTWTPLCTVTARSNGGQVLVDWDAVAYNGNSGSDRTVSWRVLCDGVLIGVTSGGQNVPLAGQPRVFAGYKARSTPAAGGHTWVLQALASAASAVFVESATMTVTEY